MVVLQKLITVNT
ncbi:hypothetical protein FWK35_00035842 [Aphis craccivora]|uniref:Uncharacterized protein n=1 Tax=Aphis craccivora TaxID=307492 RepID=A0A6G0VUB6_APHCR|nr:hypothetical protein FWK35_00035842 [Aphis craccivora]